MHRFWKHWEPISGYDGGYLAGLYDGEGHICCPAKAGGVIIGFGQKSGGVLDRLYDLLVKYEIPYSSLPNAESGVVNVVLLGSWSQKIEGLGRLRPQRLIQKLQRAVEAGNFCPELEGSDLVEVVGAVYEGEQPVIAMGTTTKTFFADGFGAHNSVGQHSVLVSLHCDPEDALWGLLHDAAEAYLVDLPRPLKHHPGFGVYREAEDRVMVAVCEKFGLAKEMPQSVHWADGVLLATEKRDLLGPEPSPWCPMPDPMEETILALTPNQAKRLFLARFHQLNGDGDR